ncbi:MAG: exodeoxyribonuclease VII small subunit [Lawsonella clevelandensis]
MAQKNDGPQPVAELNYEEARDELMNTVRQLEQGGLSLDDSLALWERREELGQRCEELLAGAHKRIEDALAARAANDDDGNAPSSTDTSAGT